MKAATTALIFIALFGIAAAANFKCCAYSFVNPDEHVGVNPDTLCPQMCVTRWVSCPLPASYVGVCFADPTYERPSNTCKELGCRVPRQVAYVESVQAAGKGAITAAVAAMSV